MNHETNKAQNLKYKEFLNNEYRNSPIDFETPIVDTSFLLLKYTREQVERVRIQSSVIYTSSLHMLVKWE